MSIKDRIKALNDIEKAKKENEKNFELTHYRRKSSIYSAGKLYILNFKFLNYRKAFTFIQ